MTCAHSEPPLLCHQLELLRPHSRLSRSSDRELPHFRGISAIIDVPHGRTVEFCFEVQPLSTYAPPLDPLLWKS